LAKQELPPVVLVIDDNEANRALAKGALEDEGYSVVLAAGGEEGLEAFTRCHPDCVLLDVRMPDVDGFEVCEKIRGLPDGAGVPVLFLTALRDVDTFDHALRAGGDDFLTKPIRPTELLVRVQTAMKLRRMSVELREHYDLLRRQRDDLLRVQLQKERLSAFIVHDLKNPVGSMDLNAQLLLRDPTLSDASRSAATQIRSSARNLNRMILDLLDVAKADEGKLTARVARIELSPLVDRVFVDLSASARDRRITLAASLDVLRVSADENLLHRILVNLVENAIRHSPAETTVLVRSTQVEGGVDLRVIDAGTGIDPRLRDQIFEPFVQIDSPDHPRARGGRGLGLSFCKKAVQAQGGEIWVEDVPPGATFCVRLPDVP
jgi:signal transduction histidine kinase